MSHRFRPGVLFGDEVTELLNYANDVKGLSIVPLGQVQVIYAIENNVFSK